MKLLHICLGRSYEISKENGRISGLAWLVENVLGYLIKSLLNIFSIPSSLSQGGRDVMVFTAPSWSLNGSKWRYWAAFFVKLQRLLLRFIYVRVRVCRQDYILFELFDVHGFILRLRAILYGILGQLVCVITNLILFKFQFLVWHLRRLLVISV